MKGRIPMHYRVLMCFPGGKRKAFTMSYDDGVEQDIRLIELMKKYGVKGTFNLGSACFPPPGTTYPAGKVYRRMTQEQCLNAYDWDGVEIAAHGAHHGYLDKVPLATAVLEMVNDRKALEELFGRIIRGFVYPFATYTDEVVDALRACGSVYARTAAATHDFKMPSDWLRLDPTCHHNDEQLDALTERFLNETPAHEPWMFYLWGHTYEFDQRQNWERIENLLARISGREDVWYATNIEIYEYTRAFESLVFSAESSLVSNPTAQDVYVLIDEKTVCVPAGCVNMKI